VHESEDTTVWIGYADFLMTLAILFFVLTIVFAARVVREPAFVRGEVIRVSDGEASGVSSCVVEAGAGDERRQTTDEDGRFEFRFDGIWRPIDLEIAVSCSGYEQLDTVTTIVPGDTVFLEISVIPAVPSDVTVIVLPGDALFAINEFVIRPEARAAVQAVADSFRVELRSGELIAVQGHTDDRPFPAGAGTDNWTLSGQRAAAAANVLIESGISPCQIVTMGFGPSRPRSDIPSANRRIEFRRLRGADLTGTLAAGCPQ
jgi:outer membrane protein OmpA-like peptidoglycan-associated protein